MSIFVSWESRRAQSLFNVTVFFLQLFLPSYFFSRCSTPLKAVAAKLIVAAAVSP